MAGAVEVATSLRAPYESFTLRGAATQPGSACARCGGACARCGGAWAPVHPIRIAGRTSSTLRPPDIGTTGERIGVKARCPEDPVALRLRVQAKGVSRSCRPVEEPTCGLVGHSTTSQPRKPGRPTERRVPQLCPPEQPGPSLGRYSVQPVPDESPVPNCPYGIHLRSHGQRPCATVDRCVWTGHPARRRAQAR